MLGGANAWMGECVGGGEGWVAERWWEEGLRSTGAEVTEQLGVLNCERADS